MRTTGSAVLLMIVLAWSCGCTRVRFIIDTLPAEDELTEATVMADAGASRASKVALVDVTGLIADADAPGLLAPGENPVARFVESLNVAAKDANVKALIVRINSPGGTVTASDVMYRELMHFKKSTAKPVVVCMADVAASGGYYLACAGDEIIAHPTTITGSIGVIMQTFNFTDGMRKIGIRADAITSGPNKAMGSPFEPMSSEHRQLLHDIVIEFYGNFRSIVTASRPAISASNIDQVTDGRIVTGARAAELGLIDAVGDLRDAFAAAKRRAKLSQAQLIKYHRPLEHVGSAYAAAPPGAPAASLNLVQLNISSRDGASPNFWYLWDPTAW